MQAGGEDRREAGVINAGHLAWIIPLAFVSGFVTAYVLLWVVLNGIFPEAWKKKK